MICPCCKGTMKTVGTMIRRDEVEFFLRFHGLWKGITALPPPHDYVGIILIGAYAMDRLRYQETVLLGQPNQAPAVRFLREALMVSGLKIGTICHSLWLFCADPAMLTDRKVTCAHNIVCDVENAGGVVQYEGDQTATLVIDGDLITGKHPSMVKQFMERFVAEIQLSS